MRRRLLPLVALPLLTLAASVHADTPPPATAQVAVAAATGAAAPSDPELARLRASQGHSLKWNYVPAGSTARYGHSEVLINAPVDLVRTQVLDFAHYREYSNGKFKTARIVDKNQGAPGTTDLYVQVPILHGMIMLWQIIRFDPLKTIAPGTEYLSGTLVRGNVSAADIRITIRVIDPQTTILKCDVLITPELAAPQSAIDEELRDAAQNAVDAVQFRAHKKIADDLAAAIASGSTTPPAPPPTAVADGTKPAN